MDMDEKQFRSAIIEASNRAEATALLIRCGYRVYRPEADIYGEDLVVLPPDGQLHGVQLKGRPTVDRSKYGNKNLWMLFPSSQYNKLKVRDWFLIPHDILYDWIKQKHGKAPKWNDTWSYPNPTQSLLSFLAPYKLGAKRENDKFRWGSGQLAVILPDGPDTPKLRRARRALFKLEATGMTLKARNA